jgi:hypothetical protein
MSSNYNRVPRPAVVAVSGQGTGGSAGTDGAAGGATDRVVLRRETDDDLMLLETR